MALTLRPNLPADFDTLYALDQICYPRGIAYSKRTLRQYLEIPGAICIVAEDNEATASPALSSPNPRRPKRTSLLST